jgi:hypothetical protein
MGRMGHMHNTIVGRFLHKVTLSLPTCEHLEFVVLSYVEEWQIVPPTQELNGPIIFFNFFSCIRLQRDYNIV